MSEPTWTAKMFDENKALKAKVAAHEYRADYWKSECLELQTKVEDLTAALKDIYKVTNERQVMSIVMANLPQPKTIPAALKEDEDEHDM